MKPTEAPVKLPVKKRKIAGHEVVLNVSFFQSMIRFIAMLLLPILALLIDKHLLIYTTPVMAYLFITAITQFCIIKYAWHRYVKHEPPPIRPEYGKDPNFPEETV
jgi:hypothetical protein